MCARGMPHRRLCKLRPGRPVLTWQRQEPAAPALPQPLPCPIRCPAPAPAMPQPPARSPVAARGCAVQLGPKVHAVVRLYYNHRQRHGGTLAGGSCRAQGSGFARTGRQVGGCRWGLEVAHAHSAGKQAGDDGARSRTLLLFSPHCIVALGLHRQRDPQQHRQRRAADQHAHKEAGCKCRDAGGGAGARWAGRSGRARVLCCTGLWRTCASRATILQNAGSLSH